ncbi:hypothetical protein [Nocardia farcinica]|nr:hypothetical protein [Nocardia farcinica]
MQSISRSWVKQDNCSATVRSAPIVREIGMDSVSAGSLCAKWWA